MDPILKNCIRQGYVSSIDPTTATAKVTFPADGDSVSYDLPVLMHGTSEVKAYWMPVPGEQVACIFLPNGNARGFVLGSFYSEVNVPPVSSKDKRYMKFDDGTVIEYDQAAKKLTIDAVGEITIKAKRVNIAASEGVSITGKDDSESW